MGEKNWDNCNSIINKIYLKKEFPYRTEVMLSYLNNSVPNVQRY